MTSKQLGLSLYISMAILHLLLGLLNSSDLVILWSQLFGFGFWLFMAKHEGLLND